ncbi:MAG: dihydropteroate synthase [Fusobacteriaceae bacterium]|nr:dihydropteroate synthase [Fusobacteriaceae bacterium]
MMILNCRNKKLELGKRTIIMGILNITPDSFSDGGKYYQTDLAFEHARKLIADGADILDIGGESTRPGYIQISDEEEIERVVSIIEKISKELDTIISIDTYKYKVAENAIDAGAHIVNDIWGLQYDDGQMADLVGACNVPLIAMHNQNNKEYNEDIISAIRKFFEKTYLIAFEHNIPKENIILDPGIGFGKDINLNIEVLKRLSEIRDMGRILLGTSKKRFIGTILGDVSTDDRIEGTIASSVIGVMNGVDIIRVHNVLENKRAIMVADEIIRGNK